MADYSVYSDPFLNQWANYATPIMQQLSNAGRDNQTPYPVPGVPQPTSSWWNSLSPDYKAGLYYPYAEAGKGMMEHLNAVGQAGNPRGGASGVAGAAMSDLAAKAGQQVGLQAWQQMSPLYSQQYGAAAQAYRDPFSLMPSYMGAGTGYGSTLIGNQPEQSTASQIGQYGTLAYLATQALGGLSGIGKGLGSAYDWLSGMGSSGSGIANTDYFSGSYGQNAMSGLLSDWGMSDAFSGYDFSYVPSF